MVYVDRVVHKCRSVDRDYYTLGGWTTHDLNLRENKEKEYGQFGVGTIDDVMTEVVDTAENDQDVKVL